MIPAPTPKPTQIPMSNPPHLAIIHSYRHMYRALLRAVQFSKPARYVARDQLRDAYRKGQLSNFDSVKIIQTLQFLKGAARERGLEHKILRNLLLTRYHHANDARSERVLKRQEGYYERPSTLNAAKIQSTAFVHYDMTVAMLNDSMGLCLR